MIPCATCGKEADMTFHGNCRQCVVDAFDDDDGGCYECGGEGFVSDCVEEWACVDPEYGCDYCTQRCPLCNPPKRPTPPRTDDGEDG